MLIVTRRVGESICIGDDVKVVVLEVKGNQVRLATRAPRDIPVYREEVFQRISREAATQLQSAAESASTPGA